MAKPTPLAPPDPAMFIRTIRGQRVILDSDLARIYGVPTFRFNEAVKRNRQRFPEDFLFQLTTQEQEALTSQIAISKPGRGGRRTRPFAFTEYGAFQAANILNSAKAQAISPLTNAPGAATSPIAAPGRYMSCARRPESLSSRSAQSRVRQAPRA